MNLISWNLDRKIVKFFKSRFVKAAGYFRKQNIQLLTTGPDSKCRTYYVQRNKTRMESNDFELNLADPVQVRKYLCNYWEDSQKPILNDLTDDILSLAPYFDSVKDTEDISPLIYIMF